MNGQAIRQMARDEVLMAAYGRADERAWRLADLVMAAEGEGEFVQHVRLARLVEHLEQGRVVVPQLCPGTRWVAVEVGR